MTIYDELGVRTVINAATTLTVVGGSRMPDEVLAAMRSAAGAYVDMRELQAAAGAHLAELTGNEAAYVDLELRGRPDARDAGRDHPRRPGGDRPDAGAATACPPRS